MAARTGADLVATVKRAGIFVSGSGQPGTILGIATDSRQVVAGSAFIAVRGSQQDGHQYAAQAVAAGAGLVVTDHPLGLGVPEVVVTDGRLAAIALARWWYDDPAAKLSLIGVTGTSGKTTTTLLIRHLFNEGGRAGSIGTLGAFDGLGRAIPSTAGSLTTPGPVDLMATLAGLVAAGVDRVAMETSSHSLDQGRLDDLGFDAGVFTNLSREHLDYHRTMDDYRLAKLKLLGRLAPGGLAVVNRDEPAWDSLGGSAAVVTFGQHPEAHVRAEGVVLGPTSSGFLLTGRFGSGEVQVPLPGDFNVANALAAAGTALGLGLALDTVIQRLSDAPQVPGRMERLAETPCVVIRDYAHKPDALERVLATLRPITPGRLICLFGCGGDRDRGKRPIMGRIAALGSDLTIVTSDNPRTESPEQILDDIVAGIPTGSAYQRQLDRRRAIEQALSVARAGDTVLLAGKGHETYQIVGKEYLPFDEREIVQQLLGRGR